MRDLTQDSLNEDYVKIGTSGHFELGSGISGSVSCLKIFDRFMLPAEIRHARHCESVPGASEKPCPPGHTYFEGNCFMVSEKAKSFLEAELDCLSKNPGSGYRTILANPSNRQVREFLVQMTYESSGESQLWFGLDDRNEDGKWVGR